MPLLNNKVLALIVALPAEARPFIRKLGLQRVNGSRAPNYESENFCLIVSGVGRKKAAAATASLLEKVKPLALCNVGICGSRTKRYAVGSTIYVNRIHDSLTGKAYYPDPLAHHEFPEDGLVTHDEPQIQSSANRWPDSSLVDMEAAAVCQEIEKVLPPHRCHFLKIVSDHLEGNELRADYVENIVAGACDAIGSFMENLRSVVGAEIQFNEIAARKLEDLSKSLRLTATQKSHLERLCLYRISAGDLNLEVLHVFNNYVSAVKLERNKIFKEICHVLLP